MNSSIFDEPRHKIALAFPFVFLMRLVCRSKNRFSKLLGKRGCTIRKKTCGTIIQNYEGRTKIEEAIAHSLGGCSLLIIRESAAVVPNFLEGEEEVAYGAWRDLCVKSQP